MPHLPACLSDLRLPMIASPLFLVSGPELVIAQCKAGVVGSFPALNAREKPGEPNQLEAWLKTITEELDRHNQANPDRPAAPFAVNQIVHRTNERLERDTEICARWQVPIWITSLGAREDVNQIAHQAGGFVLHDVTTNTYANKAIAKGADGLIAVAAGAGGHAGAQSPFALISEIREWFDGPLALSGAIANGTSLLAARILGADLGYVGSAFIATDEANAVDAYKQMIVDDCAEDVMYTPHFTGVPGNYLKNSVRLAGMDPNNLSQESQAAIDLSRPSEVKAWRDIWGSGHGISSVKERGPVSALIDRIEREYKEAKQALCA